jgi:hypothetical protein
MGRRERSLKEVLADQRQVRSAISWRLELYDISLNGRYHFGILNQMEEGDRIPQPLGESNSGEGTACRNHRVSCS